MHAFLPCQRKYNQTEAKKAVACSVSTLLSHAKENTTKQKPGKLSHVLFPLFFPIITCAQQLCCHLLENFSKTAPTLTYQFCFLYCFRTCYCLWVPVLLSPPPGVLIRVHSLFMRQGGMGENFHYFFRSLPKYLIDFLGPPPPSNLQFKQK